MRGAFPPAIQRLTYFNWSAGYCSAGDAKYLIQKTQTLVVKPVAVAPLLVFLAPKCRNSKKTKKQKKQMPRSAAADRAGDALDAVRPRGVPPAENRLRGRGGRARTGRPDGRRTRLGPASCFPRGPGEEGVRKGCPPPDRGRERMMFALVLVLVRV